MNLGKITHHLISGANVATIVIMLLVGCADRVSPTEHPTLACMGLAFPIFVFLNAAFLFFWLFVKPIRALIPAAGFIVAYGPMRIYTPLNIPQTPPEGSIKVLSYNIYNYLTWESADQPCPISDYIVRENADIVCLVESSIWGAKERKIDSIYTRHYAYRDSSSRGGGDDRIDILSRFPIIGKERIDYSSRSNHSVAFRLKTEDDTITVIINHFQSIGLSSEERTQFKEMVKGGVQRDAAKQESQQILRKLAEASAVRAPQADAVAHYIDERPGESFIVVGDFNDSPLSYTRRTLAERLTDCYVATGNGPGISYHYNAFFVRIDNIMCSRNFTPYACRVDNTIKASDHYPIVCWLDRKNETEK